jgi:enhancing lycopene biosynthesis protein 2
MPAHLRGARRNSWQKPAESGKFEFMKKVAVILSGCGVFDGAEIHESVLVLLALDRAGAQIVCAAPDIPQQDVINHLTRQADKTQVRNVLVESARIARGAIVPLSQLKVAEIDAIILPGGFGAAKNLCDFAFKGPDFKVNSELASLLREAHRAGKPLGFVCIAPAVAARLFGPEGIEFTIGTDRETAGALAGSGGKHVGCEVRDVVVDRAGKIVSTPAYMLAQRITEAEAGINKLVQAVLEMA